MGKWVLFMSNYTSDDFDELGFGEFEEKFVKLLRLCEQLKAENTALRARQTTLLEEHSELMDKNELARTKVTSILNRLKSVEFES